MPIFFDLLLFISVIDSHNFVVSVLIIRMRSLVLFVRHSKILNFEKPIAFKFVVHFACIGSWVLLSILV